MDIRRAICEAVSKMPRLTDYIVISSPPNLSIDQLVVGVLPEFTAFSPQFCQNLQTVDLSMQMSGLAALNLHGVDFPCLQTFKLNTTAGGDPEVEETESHMHLIIVLAPFLRRCRSTLKRLSISINVDLDSSPFLDLLGAFPNLVSVSLHYKLERQDVLSGCTVTNFINRHAETLRNLVFKPCTSLQRISNIFSNINLPHLQSLDVGLGTYSTSIATLERCIRPFANTLTAIHLEHEWLSFAELQIVSGLFAQEPHILKTAYFSLHVLSPRVVDLLADNLQELQDLTLLFLSITDDARALDAPSCCGEVWYIQHLILCTTYSPRRFILAASILSGNGRAFIPQLAPTQRCAVAPIVLQV
jgi:hypothetical protein